MSDQKPKDSVINISIGNYVNGDVNGPVGNNSIVVNGDYIKVVYGSNSVVTLNANDPFHDVYSKVASKPAPEKTNLIGEIEPLRQEVQKRQGIRQDFLQERLTNLARMAPDIFEVVVATLVNPAYGFATVVGKIAKKIQNEYGNGTSK